MKKLLLLSLITSALSFGVTREMDVCIADVQGSKDTQYIVMTEKGKKTFLHATAMTIKSNIPDIVKSGIGHHEAIDTSGKYTTDNITHSLVWSQNFFPGAPKSKTMATFQIGAQTSDSFELKPVYHSKEVKPAGTISTTMCGKAVFN